MELYEELKKDNKVLKIFYDEDSESPREWDNLSKFVLNHRRYNFPNELDINFDAFSNWEEISEYLKNELKALIIKPISMYDHSGISLYYDCVKSGWDSGQLGLICVTEEDILKEYGEVTEETLKKAEEVLKGEFENFKNYIENNVYRFELYEVVNVKIRKDYSDGTFKEFEEEELKGLDSCCGYYGDDGLNQIKTECNFN